MVFFLASFNKRGARLMAPRKLFLAPHLPERMHQPERARHRPQRVDAQLGLSSRDRGILEVGVAAPNVARYLGDCEPATRVTVLAAGRYGDIQSFADVCKDRLVDPCAVPVRTRHPCKSGRACGHSGLGGKPQSTVGTIYLRRMFVAELSDCRGELFEDFLTQGSVVNRRRIFQTQSKLIERLAVGPRAVMVGASHSAKSDRDSGVEILAALRTMDCLGVFAPQSFQDFFIVLTRPLVLTTHSNVVDLVT
jgi:hypothetical protein